MKELIESDVIGEPHFAKANYWESFGRYWILCVAEEASISL